MLKVKLYKQSSGFCGPASLRMVLEYWGLKKSEKELAKLSGATRSRGIEARGLLRAAKKLGLRVTIIDYATFEQIRTYVQKQKIPVIVDWFSHDDGHYSVVVGISRRKIFLADPEHKKIRQFDLETFKRIWFDFPGKYLKSPKDLILRQMIVIFK